MTHCNYFKVKVTLRPTVSRPVCLGGRYTYATRDQFFFNLEIFFRELRVCYFVALLLQVTASAVTLGSALSDERSGLSFVSLLSVSVYSQSVCT
jgi:hypothetical protein